MEVELAWPAADRRFRAMGTDCHIIVVGPDAASGLDAAVARVGRLEDTWSRFLADSEVSELNRNGGTARPVSIDTIELVERAALAWKLTGGRFDPTMARQLVELGYDRPFEAITSGQGSESGTRNAASNDRNSRVDREATPAVGCADIVIDRVAGTVTLPVGVQFDPGGIGKGLAADLVAEEAMARGAWGVMVNLGGDLRTIGSPPSGDAWAVAIAEPTVQPDIITIVNLGDGALATSTTGRRRWTEDGRQQHHLLDPVTGRPAADGIQLASVIAGQAWWAEAVATTLCAAASDPIAHSPDSHDPSRHPSDFAALTIGGDGNTNRIGNFESYEQPT